MDSKNSRFTALGIVAALVVAVAPLAEGAQTAPRQLPANPAPNPNCAAPQDRPPAPRQDQFDRAPRGYEAREARLECRLDFLHSELHITPAQQRLWDDFANTVRQEADRTRDRDLNRSPGPYAGPNPVPDRRDDFRDRNNGRYGPPSVVQRLERRQQNLADRGTRVDHLLSALRPLYATLAEDQRRAADELMFRRDQSRQARWGFAMRGRFQRPFDRPYGPFDPPFDRFDRYR